MAETVVAALVGIERVPDSAPSLPAAVAKVMAEIVRSAATGRYCRALVARMVTETVAAVTMPGLKKVVQGLQRAPYPPVVFLELLNCWIDSPGPVRAHSFHKSARSPVAVRRKIGNVAC